MGISRADGGRGHAQIGAGHIDSGRGFIHIVPVDQIAVAVDGRRLADDRLARDGGRLLVDDERIVRDVSDPDDMPFDAQGVARPDAGGLDIGNMLAVLAFVDFGNAVIAGILAVHKRAAQHLADKRRAARTVHRAGPHGIAHAGALMRRGIIL